MMNVLSNISSDMKKRGAELSLVEIPSVQGPAERDRRPVDHKFFSQREMSYMDDMKVEKRKMDFFSGRIAGKQAVKGLIDAGVISLQEARSDSIGYNSIEIRKTRTGAPRVFFNDVPARVRVSISHSPNLAAGAACSGDSCRGIGIDLEEIAERHESFFKIAFGEPELKSMADLCEKNGYTMDEIATRYWSIKEAVLKSMGVGLNMDLRNIMISENEQNEIKVVLKKDVKQRFEDFNATDIDVSSYRINDHFLSVAYLK